MRETCATSWCVNVFRTRSIIDTVWWTFLSLENGYKYEDIKMLTDEIDSVTPTKENILDALSWLVKGARSGDSLFIHCTLGLFLYIPFLTFAVHTQTLDTEARLLIRMVMRSTEKTKVFPSNHFTQWIIYWKSILLQSLSASGRLIFLTMCVHILSICDGSVDFFATQEIHEKLKPLPSDCRLTVRSFFEPRALIKYLTPVVFIRLCSM